MAEDITISIEVDVEPSDSDSDCGPGRSYNPKVENPGERGAKFDTYSQVYLKSQTAGGERAHVMTVKARKKIEKTYKNKKWIFWEYQLEDSANQLYGKGEWIPERNLESADGS